MACIDCRYYPLETDMYPCLECENNNMFKSKEDTDVIEEIMTLRNEVRDLRKLVKGLIATWPDE